jgi:plastocyanin domain-containing protein
MRTMIASILLSALTSAAPALAAPAAGQSQVIEMAVTSKGFEPAQVAVRAGKPVTLNITRKTDRTCATEIVLKDYGIKKDLPLNQPVSVTFTPTKTGSVRYSCAMNMIGGVLLVQ